MKPATSITKVCRLLSEFRTRPSIGVTELAGRTGLLPSDVHRILSSLKTYGYIEQDRHSKTYRLGIGVLKLGLTALQRSEFRLAARPVLKKLSDDMAVTAHMAIFDMDELEIFLTEQADFPSDMPIRGTFGAPLSVHSTALGKAIMASMDQETVLRTLKKNGMPKRTTQTITELPVLQAELDRSRKIGYAIDLEETARGACCIAATVQDATGSPVGAISVSMEANRYYASHEAALAKQVLLAASEVSTAIGHPRLLVS